MNTPKNFVAEVKLCTGVSVKAIVQAANIFQASKTLTDLYGAEMVGLVKEHHDDKISGIGQSDLRKSNSKNRR